MGNKIRNINSRGFSMVEKIEKVLVTGCDGYIGSVLTPYLINHGFPVIGLDTGFYRDGLLFNDSKTNKRFPIIINKDTRLIDEKDLEGIDAIVHMAELSNDPLGENNPNVTYEINYHASVRLAKLAKKMGISRFIYTSSCSVYGCSDSEVMNEESPTSPQTLYAECKVLVERELNKLADQKFSPVCLRNATVHGVSPRIRFDVVLNNLAGLAWTTKMITMTSDGSPWRPLVHINDVCNAIKICLTTTKETIHNQIFNVGHNNDNYQIKEIGSLIQNTFTDCKVTFGNSSSDNRSYRVNFDKIHNCLPEFSCQWDARKGVEQLYELFKRIQLSDQTFTSRFFTRLNNIKYLLATKQIDDHFFWSDK